MTILLSGIFILIAIIAHEMAHAYMSFFLGDPTPKETGRLTPNPLKHVDIFGIIFMLLFRAGWAKPVQINTDYYKHRKLGIFLVALAGPAINIILSLSSMLLAVVTIKFVTNQEVAKIIFDLCVSFSAINMSLALFNLIPIPPLDGSRILGSFLSANAYLGYMKVERYGFYIIFGLIGLDNLLSIMTGKETLFSQVLYNIVIFIYETLCMLIL